MSESNVGGNESDVFPPKFSSQVPVVDDAQTYLGGYFNSCFLPGIKAYLVG